MSDEYVLLNDEYIVKSKAHISVDDSGFLYGFGAFDTLLALNGKPLFIDEHINRLNFSLKALKIELDKVQPGKLETDIINLLLKNNLNNARVRITVTKGIINLQNLSSINPDITKLITAVKIEEDYYHRKINPLKLMVSSIIRNHPQSLPPSLKLTNLANHFFASMEAKDKGFDDGIMLSHAGYLSEGSSFNIFFAKNGVIYTPHLDTGILPGITRDVILKILSEKGYKYKEGYYKSQELYEADEAFATSSVKGIVPIEGVDQYIFKTNELTTEITRLYYELLQSF